MIPKIIFDIFKIKITFKFQGLINFNIFKVFLNIKITIKLHKFVIIHNILNKKKNKKQFNYMIHKYLSLKPKLLQIE